MKKWILLSLAALLLCGCTAQPEDVSVEMPQETQPAAVCLYEADSAAEAATDGAVRAYSLEQEHTGLIPVGDMLMAVSKDGAITLLQGAEGRVVASVKTDMSAAWGMDDLYAGSQNIGYYAADTQEAVILDHALQELYRISMPEDMQGKPVIQLDKGEIFYCTTGQIRAINVQTGISRMVRSHACMSQELLGSFFGDSVIGCKIVDQQGQESVQYLDPTTGQLLYEDFGQSKLQTVGQQFYAVVAGEEGTQILFGTGREERMLLAISPESLTPALQAGGVVHSSTDAEGLCLSFYDLAAGTRSSQVTVPGLESGKIAATGDGAVWILSGQTLYRWDTAKTPTKEETVYTSKVYTADRPDEEGLAHCGETADRLGQTYGLTLRIYEEAAAAGVNYRAETEYRVPETEQTLTLLENILAALPEGFMSTTGDVNVYLVQSLENDVDRALYWADGACHIFLTGENTQEAFLWGLGNAVDTRVLGNSFDYDKWDDLNPWWFEYTYDYEENLKREDPEEYLEGDNRCFADLTAMSFPTEDRSRLFANAILEDNGDMFLSSAMQKKLRTICVAIREAYGWEDSTEIYPWEQYLNKPVAAGG